MSKNLAFHIYLRKIVEKDKRWQLGLPTPLVPRLHTSTLGRYCAVWPLIHSSFHSSYQLHSAISQTHCPALRQCVTFRWLEDSVLFQCTFGKWKFTKSQDFIQMTKARATGNAFIWLQHTLKSLEFFLNLKDTLVHIFQSVHFRVVYGGGGPNKQRLPLVT